MDTVGLTIFEKEVFPLSTCPTVHFTVGAFREID
jgi:hypothetical protein